MRVDNNPFINDEEEYQQADIEDERISIIEAKNMIRNVSYQEFMNCCSFMGVPSYFHSLYYLHYLAMKGEFIRLKNLVIELQEKNININKIINYNKIPEFNYSSLIQTIITWNANTEIITYFNEHYNCDFEVCDSMGCMLSDIIEQGDEMYIFPFTNILGYGEIIHEKYKVYRRIAGDFEQMNTFIRNTFHNGIIEQEEEEEDIMVVNHLPNMNNYIINNNAYNDNAYADGGINNIVPNMDAINNMGPINNMPFDNNNLNENHNNKFVFEEMNELLEIVNNQNELVEQDEENIRNKIISDEVIEHVSKMDISDDVQEKLLDYLIELEIYTEEDLLYPRISHDDLYELMVEQSDVKLIWNYIREHSPNYIDGRLMV